MTYTRNPTWVDGVTQANAAVMENIEAGIQRAGAMPHVLPVTGNVRLGSIPGNGGWTFVDPNVALCYPVYYETAFSVNGLGVHLRSQVVGTCYLGLFRNVPGEFKPGVVVAQTSLDTSVAGWKDAAFTTVSGLPAGWYWHASSYSASLDVFCLADAHTWQDATNMELAVRTDNYVWKSTGVSVIGTFADNPATYASHQRAPGVAVRFA